MGILAAMAVPHPPIILPEIGKGEESKIQDTIDSFRNVMQRTAALRPDTIVLTSPHSVMYADYFHISPGEKAKGSFAQFRAPEVELEAEYDSEFVKELSDLCGKKGLSAGTLGERSAALDHGTMIPLRFLQEHSMNCKLVRIGLSGLPAKEHYRLGQYIAQTAEKLNRRVVFIASGDLSHKLKEDGPYGFVPEGPVFDRQVTTYLGEGDFLSLLSMDAELCEKASECGLRSFWIMAGALDRRGVESELLSCEGPFGVGYGVAWLLAAGRDESRNIGEQYLRQQREVMEARKAKEDALVRLARLSLETYVKTHRILEELPENLPKELKERAAGAFVSLKKDGQLRGCIGTIMPTRDSLAEEIVQNAVSACSRDPRFSPVEETELEDLVYSVDVLSEPERIFSTDELDVKRYGVIVESNGRRGLLLPDLSGIDTVEEQIAIARKKGNIGPRDEIQLWRFEVVRHT
ncbi:MAG: AmmeMemoRadiSam system protein A [Selenomonadaceae bacterium]|nr:AmmeMemoRadiSam system protein A [Selenomonadaceae bacterium]